MGRPKKDGPKTRPVRLTEEAMKWAKVASALTGETMQDYVSRIVQERAREDAARLMGPSMRPGPHKPKGGE
jgi:hypothetical protein